MEQEKIAKIIKEIRTKNSMTQKEFADKFGVTYQAVSKWETGKNLPDINILQNICQEYSISIDEILNTMPPKKNSSKTKYILISLTILLLILLGIIFCFYTKEETFEFKTLTSTCKNFKVSGSIAYNDTKSSIYISHVDYCGGDDTIEYNKLSCILYEVDGDLKKEISQYNYNDTKKITLEEFLSDVTFKIDDYTKVCKSYQENSFLLEVNALDNEENISYKIPLKLNDDCSTES